MRNCEQMEIMKNVAITWENSIEMQTKTSNRNNKNNKVFGMMFDAKCNK